MCRRDARHRARRFGVDQQRDAFLRLDPQDEDDAAIAALNEQIASDERVDVAMLPMIDGLTLVLVR